MPGSSPRDSAISMHSQARSGFYFCSSSLSQPHHIEGGHGLAESLERKFPCRLSLHQLLHHSVDPLTDEDLPALGLVAQAGGEVCHRTDGPIVNPAFESDHSQGGISLSDPYSETQLLPALQPPFSQLAHLLAHSHSHPHSLCCMIWVGKWIVEKDHHPIASEVLQRPFEVEDQGPQGRVIFS